MREHGSKDGLDKFKATSIKLFKNSSDFAGFKKDCLAAFQHFRSGLECVNLLAHFNKKEYGIDPDNEILLRMFDSFDKNMATRTQIALGRRIDLLLNKFESGEDRPDFGQADRPDRKQGPGAIQRMAPVHIINEDLDWDTENEHVVLDFGPDDDTEHEHFDEALILSKVTDGGKVDYQQNWVNLRQVRAVPAREKVRFLAAAQPNPGGPILRGCGLTRPALRLAIKHSAVLPEKNMPVAGRPSVLRQRAYTVTCHLVTRPLGDAQPARLGPPPPTSTPFETTLDRPDTTGSLYTIQRGGSELYVTP